METPEPEPVGGRGGTTSDGGRGGASTAGRGGAVNAGTGGSAGAEEGGSSGASGGSENDEPDAGGITSPPDREYCDAVEKVFSTTCGGGSCHTNRGARIGDFGVGPAEAASFVGRGSVRNPECGLIIDPVDPQNSLILTKVNGEYPADRGCGGPMPVGSFEITDEQIDCIADWVEQFRN